MSGIRLGAPRGGRLRRRSVLQPTGQRREKMFAPGLVQDVRQIALASREREKPAGPDCSSPDATLTRLMLGSEAAGTAANGLLLGRNRQDDRTG